MRRFREYTARIRGSSRGRAVELVITTAVLALIGSAGQWLFRRPIDIAATVLLAMLVASMPWVVRTWSDVHAGVIDVTERLAPPETASSSEFSSFLLLRVQVRTSVGDPTQFTRVLRPVIAELVDDQLLRKYGVVRTARSDRARAIVGDELWSVLSAAGSPAALAVGDLEQLLDRLEQL